MGTAPKAPRAAPPPPAIKAGDVVLDRYRVVEQIASGGHSVVYLGTDERLSRPVCIKVFSGLGGKSGVGRTSYEHFVQEAFALSRLTHPNTLRIYDFGHLGEKDDQEGMPLQVCEFMNGGTLSNIVREEGTQSLAETVRVIGAMCAALGEAHALGIVHRDIKPQNILFGAVGTNRLPKLADFGIAKWSADEAESGKRAEDTAIVAGQKLAMYSPSWAAPEQLAGQPVSAATDIYSLAVVAIYMLSGKAIFADEDVYAGYKKRRHADNLIREALQPLGVPPQAIALLTRALAFDPKKRLANVEELSSGLAAALAPAEPEKVDRDTSDKIARDKPARDKPELPPASAYPVYPRMSTADVTTPLTPTVPVAAVTPPAGNPTVRLEATNAPPVVPPQVAPTPPVIPQPLQPSWRPPDVRQAWMTTAPTPSGAPRRLALADVPQPVGDRQVHFVMVTNDITDLVGGQGSRIRVTFIATAGGARVIHIKGLSCFVAPLGGRPSPAVQLDQPSDIALVTPRAQEIGHVRVATGSPDAAGHLVFPIGAERIAVGLDDCSDPILFDFGPGSDAYFVYTRGRAIPRSPRRR
jgi:serine/threonine-protein kinase